MNNFEKNEKDIRQICKECDNFRVCKNGKIEKCDLDQFAPISEDGVPTDEETEKYIRYCDDCVFNPYDCYFDRLKWCGQKEEEQIENNIDEKYKVYIVTVYEIQCHKFGNRFKLKPLYPITFHIRHSNKWGTREDKGLWWEIDDEAWNIYCAFSPEFLNKNSSKDKIKADLAEIKKEVEEQIGANWVMFVEGTETPTEQSKELIDRMKKMFEKISTNI